MTNYVKKLIRDGVEYEVAGSGDTLPKEGTTGQVLTKTDDGTEWKDIISGSTNYYVSWINKYCSSNSNYIYPYNREITNDLINPIKPGGDNFYKSCYISSLTDINPKICENLCGMGGRTIVYYPMSGEYGYTKASGGSCCALVCGNIVHNFDAADNFTIETPSQNEKSFSYIVVGGGGGGGGGARTDSSEGGGGGSGEVVFGIKHTLNTSFNIIIGQGGAGTTRVACNGGDTTFGDITARGGKGACCRNGGASGSGCTGGTHVGYGGGGGGGANENGANGICIGTNNYCGGSGGNRYGICGLISCYGGGGGANGNFGKGTGYGGGSVAIGSCNATCCGGGGNASPGSNCIGGKGGNGIVVIEYPANGETGITCATGGTVSNITYNGKAYKRHCFTSSGTFKICG